MNTWERLGCDRLVGKMGWGLLPLEEQAHGGVAPVLLLQERAWGWAAQEAQVTEGHLA